ncbi:hypothetical protein D3C80_1130450 [compost metagenome]
MPACRWAEPCGNCVDANPDQDRRQAGTPGRLLHPRTVPAGGAVQPCAARRVAGAGAGPRRADGARLQLGAPGARLAVRAMDRAAVRCAALPSAAAAGALAGGCRRAGQLRAGGGADAGLHRGGGLLRTRRPVVAHRRGQPVSAPRVDRPHHVDPAAALFLSAEPMAQAGAGRIARTDRVAAGAYPPAFSVQQPEQHRQPDRVGPGQGRGRGAQSVRPFPRQPGKTRDFNFLGGGSGVGQALSFHGAVSLWRSFADGVAGERRARWRADSSADPAAVAGEFSDLRHPAANRGWSGEGGSELP